MISLEQVRLLESKVTRTIDYVKKVTGENAVLKGKLDSYQKRIDELEVLIQQFREDQGRIEDGILAALDRLNQFEDALEKTLSAEGKDSTNGPEQPKTDAKNSRKKDEAPVKAEAPEITPETPAESGQPQPPELDSGELDIF